MRQAGKIRCPTATPENPPQVVKRAVVVVPESRVKTLKRYVSGLLSSAIAGSDLHYRRKLWLGEIRMEIDGCFRLDWMYVDLRVTNHLALQPATWAHTNTSASCTEKSSPMCCAFSFVSGKS